MTAIIKNFVKAPLTTLLGLLSGAAVPLLEWWITGDYSKEGIATAIVIFLSAGGSDFAKEKARRSRKKNAGKV